MYQPAQKRWKTTSRITAGSDESSLICSDSSLICSDSSPSLWTLWTPKLEISKIRNQWKSSRPTTCSFSTTRTWMTSRRFYSSPWIVSPPTLRKKSNYTVNTWPLIHHQPIPILCHSECRQFGTFYTAVKNLAKAWWL